MIRPGAYPIGPAGELVAVAQAWPLRWVSRGTEPGHHYADLRGRARVYQAHLVCARCDQSVACLSPDVDGAGYELSAGLIVAGVLAHVRQCHEDHLALT